MTNIIYRQIEFDHSRADEETRSVEACLSTDMLVERGFGFERLAHTTDAVDLSRAEGGLSLLLATTQPNR